MGRPIISLTTDFGQVDGYVGTMKGVILGICPEASLVDIVHDIRPHALGQAAYLLATAARYFPPGTVHLVVVDPGVGGERKPIAVQTDRAFYVAPDNGVLNLALRGDPARCAVHLTAPRFRLPDVSATFQGRDLFAPAAAYLACGANIQDMGTPCPPHSLTSLAAPYLVHEQGRLIGEIIHIDRFGNLITNIPGAAASPLYDVEVAGQQIRGLVRTFSDVGHGQLAAYAGSGGYVEIAVREGSAAARLGVDVGAPVRIGPAPGGQG